MTSDAGKSLFRAANVWRRCAPPHVIQATIIIKGHGEDINCAVL